MNHPFYLSLKATDKPALIFIKVNPHNPKGWFEASGKVSKLTNKNVKHKTI